MIHSPPRPVIGPEMETDDSDRDLIEKARLGDADAYGRLFKRRAPGIWQMAYLLLHSADAAEDVVQETFTRGLQHLATYRGDAEPKGWFCIIALNVIRMALRKKSSGEEAIGALQLENAGAHRHGVLTSLYQRETNRHLAIALGFLTEAQREVFVLHYVEGFPYEVIAGIVNSTPGAARALAHRARAILREELARDIVPG